MNNEQLIISLIKDDLINSKLVNGLTNLGLCAGDYHLHLSETILDLMGLPIEENLVHDVYFQLTQQSEQLDMTNISGRNKQLTQLAENIYNELSKYVNT